MDLDQNILQALVAEGRPEAMVNAVKAAGPSYTYDQVFSTVMDMENRNYVKLVYCQFPLIINVQLTLIGHTAVKRS